VTAPPCGGVPRLQALDLLQVELQLVHGFEVQAADIDHHRSKALHPAGAAHGQLFERDSHGLEPPFARVSQAPTVYSASIPVS